MRSFIQTAHRWFLPLLVGMLIALLAIWTIRPPTYASQGEAIGAMGNKRIVVDGPLVPVTGNQTITDLSSATTLTVPDGAYIAIISIDTQNVRFWADGTAPTATQGHQIAAGRLWLQVGGLDTFMMIEETASARGQVSFYKY